MFFGIELIQNSQPDIFQDLGGKAVLRNDNSYLVLIVQQKTLVQDQAIRAFIWYIIIILRF